MSGAPPVSGDLVQATEAIRLHRQGYERLRHGIDLLAITKARNDYGMACLAWIDLCVSKAESDDQHDPVWAARSFERGRPVFTGGKPRDVQVREAWLDYQSARIGADLETIGRAREAWRVAFVAWLQDLMV